jgi:hypothetical protein
MVEMNNEIALKDAILELKTDSKLKNKISKNAYNLIRQKEKETFNFFL